MGYEGNQDSDGLHDSDHTEQREGHEPPPCIERSIRPDMACPETTLVAIMSDGSYLLMAYPRGEPAAFVVEEEADLLKQALARAFGKHRDERAASRNSSGTSEHGTLGAKQVQP